MDYETAMDAFRAALASQRLADRPLRVLDAGCGSASSVEFPPNAYVVGIDVSADALQANQSLNERIVGDLETFELPQASFDLIVCWDVLEHLRRPQRVLDAFADALVDGGVLVLGVPNVHSVKGLVTKFTPHSFHRWIYRRAASSRSAPHRTYLRFAISLPAVRAWARRSGLSIEYVGRYEAPIQARMRRALRLTGRRWDIARTAVRLVSLGTLASDDSDWVLILARTRPAVALHSPGVGEP